MKTALWKATLKCADCGIVLNTALNVPESEKGRVSASSGLVATPCPNGCRSTETDLNLNTKLEWELMS